jgi:hypothetical protein
MGGNDEGTFNWRCGISRGHCGGQLRGCGPNGRRGRELCLWRGLRCRRQGVSTDKKDEFAAYAGVDYVFNSRQFRPNLGAAYLFEDAFVGGDIGWNISENVANFAVSGGWADTKSDNGDNNDNTPDNGSESGSGDDSGVDPGDGVEIIPVPDDEFIDPLG